MTRQKRQSGNVQSLRSITATDLLKAELPPDVEQWIKLAPSTRLSDAELERLRNWLQTYHVTFDYPACLMDDSDGRYMAWKDVVEHLFQLIEHNDAMRQLTGGEGVPEKPPAPYNPDRIERTYLAYTHACQVNGWNPVDITVRTVYQWIAEHGVEGYELKAYETFARYMSDALRRHDEPKHKSRRGRTGRSIINRDAM